MESACDVGFTCVRSDGGAGEYCVPTPTLWYSRVEITSQGFMAVTVSTDDPISFGNTITDEYAALAERRGFSRTELAQIARNG